MSEVEKLKAYIAECRKRLNENMTFTERSFIYGNISFALNRIEIITNKNP